MVVTNDIGNYKNIHPKNKQEVGRRLALPGAEECLWPEQPGCSGPIQGHGPRGRQVRLRFDNVGGGLASRDGKPLNWFEIIGEESDWTKADAVVEGDWVVLSSDKVKAPAAIRLHGTSRPSRT